MPLPPPENAGDSLQSALAFHVRDWSTDHRDAWIWGVVCGWGDESLEELVEKHGWSSKTVARLKRLHKQFLDKFELKPDEDVTF